MDSSNQSSKLFRAGCKKCGFSGHLTFQCRNYLRSEQNGNIDMDVSSTSSDSEDDEMLKEAIAKRKAELAALRKKQKSTKRRSRSSSRSSSHSHSKHKRSHRKHHHGNKHKKLEKT
ncbi:unnamed protein product [Hymenolepis diminuta]|uniref:CCHC-type domain-containing protein n=1 Tax=Hymenolepis diminuta TaxID=6216 RepID=A0A0R3SFE3_HYMDI|nr:unnamed protein product [Hymenolepis diminuta]VUZ42421.1 unnamed protein product [Hymenolepis diminuta]